MVRSKNTAELVGGFSGAGISALGFFCFLFCSVLFCVVVPPPLLVSADQGDFHLGLAHLSRCETPRAEMEWPNLNGNEPICAPH